MIQNKQKKLVIQCSKLVVNWSTVPELLQVTVGQSVSLENEFLVIYAAECLYAG